MFLRQVHISKWNGESCLKKVELDSVLKSARICLLNHLTSKENLCRTTNEARHHKFNISNTKILYLFNVTHSYRYQYGIRRIKLTSQMLQQMFKVPNRVENGKRPSFSLILCSRSPLSFRWGI